MKAGFADLDWNDLKYLRAIVQAGSLRAAATTTGVSAATLGRRVSTLEQQLGATLLMRDTTGLQATDFCRQVLTDIESMHLAAENLHRRSPHQHTPVRVSAGYWSSRFYARRTSARLTTAGVAIEWMADHKQTDIARRAATLALRNVRPQDPTLVGKRIASVAFAVYRLRGSQRDHARQDRLNEWLCLEADTPSVRWTEEQAGRIVARVSAPSLLVPLLDADVGMAVLPCFVGDDMPSLERIGQPINALEHEQWLVTRDDERRRPDVRHTIDAITDAAQQDEALLCGQRHA